MTRILAHMGDNQQDKLLSATLLNIWVPLLWSHVVMAFLEDLFPTANAIKIRQEASACISVLPSF